MSESSASLSIEDNRNSLGSTSSPQVPRLSFEQQSYESSHAFWGYVGGNGTPFGDVVQMLDTTRQGRPVLHHEAHAARLWQLLDNNNKIESDADHSEAGLTEDESQVDDEGAGDSGCDEAEVETSRSSTTDGEYEEDLDVVGCLTGNRDSLPSYTTGSMVWNRESLPSYATGSLPTHSFDDLSEIRDGYEIVYSSDTEADIDHEAVQIPGVQYGPSEDPHDRTPSVYSIQSLQFANATASSASSFVSVASTQELERERDLSPRSPRPRLPSLVSTASTEQQDQVPTLSRHWSCFPRQVLFHSNSGDNAEYTRGTAMRRGQAVITAVDTDEGVDDWWPREMIDGRPRRRLKEKRGVRRRLREWFGS